MTALATEHLTDLQHQLHTKRLARDLRQRGVPPELARLAHVLARYHDRIADGFGAPHPASTGVRDAARRAGTLLKQAEDLLGPPADSEVPRSALAQKLRAASVAFGCGLDLLSTHFPTTPDVATSANAFVIAAPDTARSLLHQLSTHTATIGHLAARTTAPADQAATLLLKAAILSRINSENRTPPPITAVPIYHTPERIPPAIGEDHTQVLTGIDASVHRLSNPTTPTSITTWRYLARAAAIICDLNSKTVQQLIHRIKELDELDHLPALKQAAKHIHQNGRTWRTIIQRWDDHVGHYGHPANGPATDAGDLIIRLGRLIHADPTWIPGPRASARVKPPDQLAPDLSRAAELATVTLKAIEACNSLAIHHCAAINDAAIIGVLDRHKKNQTQWPRIPGSALELATRYEKAQAKGRQAITSLGQAIQDLTSASTVHEETHLIVRRATANNEQTQPSLAATEFPMTVSSSLSPTQSPEHRQPTFRRSPLLPPPTSTATQKQPKSPRR
ncbi:hypothetical protein [Actinomadura welshii]|uniref:hypothetical protein n=1 Tax=Actinomadura welshii TaxID=3103817 RepID=UPI001269233A|nr:hypothetical protein [Actinomadura madurae]